MKPRPQSPQRKRVDHVAQVERVLRGENYTGFADRAVIMCHVREMQREINELYERLRMAHAQMELFRKEEV